MKRSVIFAILLLGLIAVLHAVRLVFGISLRIDGDEVPLIMSVVAILVFGFAALYLWRESKLSGG